MLRPSSSTKSTSSDGFMQSIGYKVRPRMVGFFFTNASSASYLYTHPMEHISRRLGHTTTIEQDLEQIAQHVRLTHSKDYDDGRQDEFESIECEAKYAWQKGSHPTCHLLHEIDMTHLVNAANPKRPPIRLIGNGYWRDVWYTRDIVNNNHKVALKTLRYRHDWEDRNYDRHRRDAVAMERLTFSEHIIDIYGFCGNSGLFEYASGGDIDNMLWDRHPSEPPWNATERLIVAYQVAVAIADTHEYGDGAGATMAHTDITTSQFVYVDGRYKLNDFNRCRFITKDRDTDKSCGFYVGNNPGNFRAPEEYAYEEENEKVDIYSMGNIFYCLLTDLWPFQDDESQVAQEKVLKGLRPDLPPEVQNTTDPAFLALRGAMQRCWEHKPQNRPTAGEIADGFKETLETLGIREEEEEEGEEQEKHEEKTETAATDSEAGTNKEETVR